MNDPCELYPFYEEDANYFLSGSNHAGEIRGLMLSGCQIGVSAAELSVDALDVLLTYWGAGTSLFVDSGAFAEVAFGKDGPVVKKPITDREWQKRLFIYEQLAFCWGPYAYLVAPDRVGDQAETLRRLMRYQHEIARCHALRANIIVPIQKGELPMAEFWVHAAVCLCLIGNVIPGIPMKKDATELGELVEFVKAVRPARIHLLGLGPKSPRYASTLAAVKEAHPGIEITCDSVRITALVGRGGKKPRPLTAARDAVLAEGVTDVAQIKALALKRVMLAEHRKNLEKAHGLGWEDPELGRLTRMARTYFHLFTEYVNTGRVWGKK